VAADGELGGKVGGNFHTSQPRKIVVENRNRNEGALQWCRFSVIRESLIEEATGQRGERV
jgi:hypothetical protein